MVVNCYEIVVAVLLLLVISAVALIAFVLDRRYDVLGVWVQLDDREE